MLDDLMNLPFFATSESTMYGNSQIKPHFVHISVQFLFNFKPKNSLFDSFHRFVGEN